MLIEISGIDGSGKTTLINQLRREYNSRGNAWAYERNFKSSRSRLLEQVALNEGKSRPEDVFQNELVQFSVAIEMVEESIRHLYVAGLGKKQFYFVDHYHAFWLAQSISKGSSILGDLQKLFGLLPQPDLSIYLDVSANEALARLNNREKGDQILRTPSPLNQLSKLREAFSEAKKLIPYNQIKIDGGQSQQVVFQQVLKIIDLFIESKKGEFVSAPK